MKLTPELLTLPLTDEVREAARHALALNTSESLYQDRGWRYKVCRVGGLPGVDSLTDEELVADVLDTLDF